LTPFFSFKWVLRIFVGLFGLVLLVLLYVAGHIWLVARQDNHPRSDAIVVLGASQYNGRPSAVFAARLAHAITLYDDHVAPRIVTLGGGLPGDRTTEAQAGQDYLVAHGVPGNAVLPLRTGNDTLQSVKALAAAFKSHGWHSAVLVTDPWHCLRSRTMARDQGIDAQTSPERDGPLFSSRSTEIHYIARETLAYVYYKIFGNDAVHSTAPA
jgi:uncharacterized SAM-binding protein YcdF (DUF218 family)